MAAGFLYLGVKDARNTRLHNCRIGNRNRVAALSSATGVPEPFQIAYAAYVENAPFVERALHSAFSLHKMPGREFFRLSVASAIAALSLAEVRPVALTVDDEPATIVAEVKERGARLPIGACRGRARADREAGCGWSSSGCTEWQEDGAQAQAQ